MSLAITFALDNESQKMIHISDVPSGTTSLVCLYCNAVLIAKKGDINAHHFSHTSKESCSASIIYNQSSHIPLFDDFNVLSRIEEKYLERLLKYGSKNIYSFDKMNEAIKSLAIRDIITHTTSVSNQLHATIRKLEEIGIINSNKDFQYPENQRFREITQALSSIVDIEKIWDAQITKNDILLTPEATKYIPKNFFSTQTYLSSASVLTKNSAQIFWINAHLKKLRHSHQDDNLKMQFFIKKLETILNYKLYIIKFDVRIPNVDHQEIYKIGITSRDCTIRLKEVSAYLEKIGEVVNAEIVFIGKHLGRLEKLLHNHFHKERVIIESYQEFFVLKSIRKLIKDLETIDHELPI